MINAIQVRIIINIEDFGQFQKEVELLDKESCEMHDSEGNEDDNFKLPEALSSTIEKIETTLISIFKYTGCKNLCELDRIKAVFPGLCNIEEINELDKLESRNSELLLSEPRKKVLKPKGKQILDSENSNINNINNIYSWYNYIKLREDCQNNCDIVLNEDYNNYVMQNYYMHFLREKQVLQDTLGNFDGHLGNKRRICFKVTKDAINDQANHTEMDYNDKVGSSNSKPQPLYHNNYLAQVLPNGDHITSHNNSITDSYFSTLNILNAYGNVYQSPCNLIELYQSNPKFQLQMDNLNYNYFLERFIHNSENHEPMIPSNPFSVFTQNLRETIENRIPLNFTDIPQGFEKLSKQN